MHNRLVWLPPISVNLVILVRLNCLLSEPGFSRLQDFQDKRLYADVPLQKVVLPPGQRNIYPLTPNPGNLGSDNIYVGGCFAHSDLRDYM